ncbi:MAG TPA: glycosyltransferase family 4 protein, partial [Planctomycetota bacterium]|nr:glycosyltransferase family 4 protein [Planctomycetota bacterium]
MRIVQILPGSGDRFYCENCVRDDSVVRALRKAGHDVVVAPMYLPVSVEESGRMFYGGINAYLQQNFGLFRKTPRWLDRLFDSRMLLRLSGRKAGTVRASNLGEMTLSVLRGVDGNHAKELARLLRWLETMDRPDVVHLSSALLLGIGGAIRTRLRIPVVCFLQDEDTWIDAMEEPFRIRCWEAMASEARNIDAFIAVTHYYGEVMARKLEIAPDRLHVAYAGVDTSQFEPASSPPIPPVVGYLSRLCESQG